MKLLRAERSKSMQIQHPTNKQTGFIVEYLSGMSKDDPKLYDYVLKEASARGLYHSQSSRGVALQIAKKVYDR